MIRSRKQRATAAVVAAATLAGGGMLAWHVSESGVGSFVAVMVFTGLAAVGLGAGMVILWFVPHLRSLGGTLVVALAATAPLLLGGVLPRLPLADELWARRDPARHVIEVICIVVAWEVLYLFTRLLHIGEERSIMGGIEKRLSEEDREVPWATLLPHEYDAKASMVYQRVDVIVQHKANPELLASLMAERATSDATAVQSAYGPVRALVWALPALGFIGTAATMSASISGIGAAIHGEAGSDAQQRALAEVVPNLGHAFNITLVALGVTVAAFLLLAIISQREEGMLGDIDRLGFRLVSKADTAWPPTPGVDRMDRLLTELWSLQRELAQLRGPIATFTSGDGSAFTLSQLLLLTLTELRALNDNTSAQVAAMRGLSGALRKRGQPLREPPVPDAESIAATDGNLA